MRAILPSSFCNPGQSGGFHSDASSASGGPTILAADFGGGTIKLGLVRDGQIIARSRLATSNLPMLEQLDGVACAWESLLSANGIERQSCAGVALALPFLLDHRKQRVLGEFDKFPGAGLIHFGEWSRKRLGMPVLLENDVRAALMGERQSGAAKGQSEVVMLTFGTGIGCAVLSGGRLLRGANNRAAALMGHSSIAYQAAAGRCGNIGCAEDFASTATLASRARAHPDFSRSRLSQIEKIDFESAFILSDQGDVCAQSLVQQSLKVWSVVVQNAVIAYDPELVVLGGGVMRRQEAVLAVIREHLRRHMPGAVPNISIATSQLGDDAALVGGAELFQQTQFISKS